MYKNISDCKHMSGKNKDKPTIIRGKNRISVIAACIHNACRKKDKTRSPKEIAELFGLKYTEITKGCKIFQRLAKSGQNQDALSGVKIAVVGEKTAQSLQKQNEAFARILGDESEDELPQVFNQMVNEPVQRVEVQREEITQPIRAEVAQPVATEDPIITMFKRTKRSVEFKVSVDISDKIPRLDFIEMMEDSYDISIIDFLADEFTNKILQNPTLIRESVKSKIKQLVYGTPIKEVVNPQITDAVTQVNSPTNMPGHRNPPPPPTDRILKEGELPTKPKTTRKPREKKEVSK
jgi:hypothetical protein